MVKREGGQKRGNHFQDLTKKRFGRLLVVSFHGIIKKKAKWLCRCDCGNTTLVTTCDIKSGHTVSCGCFGRERIDASRISHGETRFKDRSPEYNTWLSMRQRCNYKGNVMYKYYGGVGVRVCKRWLSFKNFLSDMGRKPSSIHTIDRFPNKEGNYELKNCRWATPIEQANNRKSNRMVTWNGQTKSVSDWCRELGVPTSLIQQRLQRGWSPEKTFTIPSLPIGSNQFTAIPNS